MADCRHSVEEGAGELRFSPAQFENIVWAGNGSNMDVGMSAGGDIETHKGTHIHALLLNTGFYGSEVPGGGRWECGLKQGRGLRA